MLEPTEVSQPCSPTEAHSEGLGGLRPASESDDREEIDSGAPGGESGALNPLEELGVSDLPWVDNGRQVYTMPEFGQYETVILNARRKRLVAILDTGELAGGPIDGVEAKEILAYLRGYSARGGLGYAQGSDAACRVALESFFGPDRDDTKGCFEGMLSNMPREELEDVFEWIRARLIEDYGEPKPALKTIVPTQYPSDRVTLPGGDYCKDDLILLGCSWRPGGAESVLGNLCTILAKAEEGDKNPRPDGPRVLSRLLWRLLEFGEAEQVDRALGALLIDTRVRVLWSLVGLEVSRNVEGRKSSTVTSFHIDDRQWVRYERKGGWIRRAETPLTKGESLAQFLCYQAALKCLSADREAGSEVQGG